VRSQPGHNEDAKLREEYAMLFRYTVAFPEFHRFMQQAAFTNNPRLKWVAETVADAGTIDPPDCRGAKAGAPSCSRSPSCSIT
jgi:hypothetical protein